MSDNEVKITIYDPSMAEKAAEMFNAFNELWPGGFGGGVPYTESRVHDWLDKTSALADLIAIDSDGVLAGYCGVYPHWRDKKAAYISILGVTPKVKGKKIGKKLLLKALEVAKEKGITRVDLHTWSGNLDAVPLYKKIGLFWVPGTTVYMQDFIPGLLQNPLAKEWFDKHPDWYSNFQRKLIQAPDEEIIDNMEIYQYHFEKDNDILLAEVDRYGWEFCALERILDGKKFALKTRVNSHKIHIGIPNSLTITIYSDYDVNEAFINVQGFEGLHWLEEFPKKVTLKKGEIQTITREFIVDKNTKTFRDNDQYCEKITSTITIDKKDYKLQTSGKIQPAVKLRGITTNRFVTLPVGKDVSLSFDLINNTQEKLTGKLVVTIDGINNFKEIINYELEPEALSGIGVSLNLPSNTNKKKFCLQIVPFIKHNNAELEMPVFDYYLLPKSTTLMEVIEIKEEKRLYLITDKLVARVQMEGGNIRLIHGENGASIPLNHASGPPYGISLDSTTLLDYQVKRDEHEITLILSMNSLQVPGLNVKKYLKTTQGLQELEYWVEYTNIQNNGSIHASARTQTASGGISVNPFSAKGRAFAPIGGKIIESDTITNFMTEPMVPNDPKLWSETWTASEGIFAKDFSAWIWKKDNIEKIKIASGSLSQLASATNELKPKETCIPVHLWYSFGFNALQEVRNRWNQLVGNVLFDRNEASVGPKINKALDIKLIGENIIPIGGTIKTAIEIFFASAYPLQGQLSLKLPENWLGYFLTEKGKESVIPIPQLKPFESTKINLEITAANKKQSPVEKISVHMSGEFELDYDSYLLITTKDGMKIEEKENQGEKVFSISNGLLSFEIPKTLTSSLFSLKDKQNNSYLVDNFPTIKPKFFIEYHLGGIRPIVFHENADEPFQKLEKCKTKAIKEGLWQGITTTWTIKEDKDYMKGQGVEVKYLTLPGSEMIKIVLTQINDTPREINSIVGLMADIGIDGSIEKNIIEAASSTRTWFRNNWKTPLISQGSFDKPYARIFKDKRSIAAIVPNGNNGTVVVGDIGVMLFMWILFISNVKPHSKNTVESIILVNQPSELMEEIRIALEK